MATAVQFVLILVPRMILLPLLVVTVVGGRSALESRVVLASLVVCSLLTLLMTVGSGRLRTDNLYVTNVDAVSLPFCILALRDGGTGTLAALVVVTGLFQILVGMRLSGLRRLITPPPLRLLGESPAVPRGRDHHRRRGRRGPRWLAGPSALRGRCLPLVGWLACRVASPAPHTVAV